MAERLGMVSYFVAQCIMTFWPPVLGGIGKEKLIGYFSMHSAILDWILHVTVDLDAQALIEASSCFAHWFVEAVLNGPICLIRRSCLGSWFTKMGHLNCPAKLPPI